MPIMAPITGPKNVVMVRELAPSATAGFKNPGAPIIAATQIPRKSENATTIPLIPSDKVPVADGKSKILLLRVGDKRQGVVGLFQPGLPGEQSPGLSVRFMGINNHAISSYLISLYCSLAVLTTDALAVLDDVEIGKYHDYTDTYK